jgi:exodeoxyribonuclease VII large subunit
MKRKVVSVSKVNYYVARLLEEDYILSDLWISGEISNCKYHQSGHIYFTLKDEKAALNCVMFQRDAQTVDFLLEDGLKVTLRAGLTLYEKTGSYQAYVKTIEREGLGDLYEKFEKLKKQLAQEGLFDEDYKKELPEFPKRVGVVTSATGAAIKDILHVAKNRNPGIPIYIYPAHVQGENAVPDMIRQIERANKDKLVDVLIVGRGGGAIEDLWAFNEEAVARAIFASEIPIVSAVGHEIDFTIADFVSDRRAATPSQAAELVFPSRAAYQEVLNHCQVMLLHHLKACLQHKTQQLNFLVNRPIFQNKAKLYQDYMILLDDRQTKLQRLYQTRLETYRMRLAEAATHLEALSPLNTLSRGYSLVKNEKNQVLKSIQKVKIGDNIEVVLSDGSILAQVTERKE